MGELGAFLKIHRVGFDKRDPAERVHDYKQYFDLPDDETLSEQGGRCMDCGVPFCQTGMMLGGMVSGCPLNNLIPEWNDMIYRGSMPYALSRLLKTNSFPEFTGRVCPAPCEAACTCALHGDAVTIHENELAIIEYAFEHGLIQPRVPSVRTGST